MEEHFYHLACIPSGVGGVTDDPSSRGRHSMRGMSSLHYRKTDDFMDGDTRVRWK